MIKFNYLLGLLLICLVSTSATTSESERGVPVNYIRTAEEFITAVKNKDNTEVFIKTFEYCKLEQLANQVATDDQRLAFWINLFFNLIFTPVQFGLKNNFLAMVVIYLILLTVAWAMFIIWPYSKFTSLAYLPYLIWVSIATVLQTQIWLLNR